MRIDLEPDVEINALLVRVNGSPVGWATARHGIIQYVDWELKEARRFVGVAELRRWLETIHALD